MDYQAFMENGAIIAAGVAGVIASGYFIEHLWPVVRVWQESGVPLRKLDLGKAKKMDNGLRNWSAMVPAGDPSRGLDEVVKDFPAEVLEAFEWHIHDKGVPLGSRWDSLYERSCMLRTRVAEFYDEPAVQAYLNKQGAQATAQSL